MPTGVPRTGDRQERERRAQIQFSETVHEQLVRDSYAYPVPKTSSAKRAQTAKSRLTNAAMWLYQRLPDGDRIEMAEAAGPNYRDDLIESSLSMTWAGRVLTTLATLCHDARTVVVGGCEAMCDRIRQERVPESLRRRIERSATTAEEREALLASERCAAQESAALRYGRIIQSLYALDDEQLDRTIRYVERMARKRDGSRGGC